MENTCNCLPRLKDGDLTATIFTEGDDLYEAMRTAIVAARESITVESYILAADNSGWSLVRALAEKAREGVRVRLLIDSAGSMFWITAEFQTFLDTSDIEFRWFRRWSWRHPGQYNRRNHRKSMVIDREKAFLGGFNIHKENSLLESGPSRIRDTHVAVAGALAAEAAQQFDAVWDGDKTFADAKPERENAILLSNIFRNCHRRFHCLYQDVLSSAESTAYLTTPYFVPDVKTQHAMIDAASRGVDVKLLLPEKRDNWAVWWAARAAYTPLLAHGVRIFEYTDRPLHAKTAVIDGSRGIVGSANLDYRSFFLNYEICLLIANASFGAELQQCFTEDLLQSHEVLESEWTKRRWSYRVREYVGWLARRWL